MKILINENQLKLINEYINPSEAYSDVDAIKTLCKGKRGVAFVAQLSEYEKEIIGKLMLKFNLDVISVPSNPHEAFIFYRNGYEENANKLLDIAEKYGGYLYAGATEEDTREIGRLLEYDPESVNEFIKKTSYLR